MLGEAADVARLPFVSLSPSLLAAAAASPAFKQGYSNCHLPISRLPCAPYADWSRRHVCATVGGGKSRVFAVSSAQNAVLA